jgi:hypothetical protein
VSKHSLLLCIIAGMVEIGRGDRRGGECADKEEKSRAMERVSVGKSNKKKKKARKFVPGGRIVGGGDLRPPQFRAGGVRTPPAAGCGGRRSPPLPRPSHRGFGKIIWRKRRSRRWESWVEILFFRTAIAGGRLRSSSCESVGHWISVHCRTFCGTICHE